MKKIEKVKTAPSFTNQVPFVQHLLTFDPRGVLLAT